MLLNDAYVAGLMDADGTYIIFFSKHGNGRRGGHYRAEAGLQIREESICRLMQAQYGGSVTKIKRSNPNHSDIYHWKATGKYIESFLDKMLPHALLKTEQINTLLGFRGIRKGCHTSPVTDEQWEAMQGLKSKMTTLNKKGGRQMNTQHRQLIKGHDHALKDS